MGFFDFIKSIPGKIASGAKWVVGKAKRGIDFAKNIAGKIGGVVNKIGSIPIIGDVAKMALETPLGQRVKNAWDTGNGILETASGIADTADRVVNPGSNYRIMPVRSPFGLNLPPD